MRKIITQPVVAPATTSNPHQLATQHAALKEKVLRSAHTDYYTRTERQHMRDELSTISAQHLQLTGKSLS